MMTEQDWIGLAAAVKAIACLQSSCQHKQVDRFTMQVRNQSGIVGQCRECLAYLPAISDEGRT